MQKKIALIGTAWPFRGGGIASFNERLALAFLEEGFDVTIYNFSLQYPSFLFPGKSQYSSDPAPESLKIVVCINSINPLNWLKIGTKIKKTKPDLVIVRYWLPFMGPCLGTILRIIKTNRFSRIICIADNIIPHEKRPGDELFTNYFVKPIDGFITMSNKVRKDLKRYSNAEAIKTEHPLYDNFGDALSKEEARLFLNISETKNIILFFGFIRKYKGLDLLLEAMKILKDRKEKDASSILPVLMIAGEFYDDESNYTNLIQKLEIADLLELRTHFIADQEVKYYLSAADFVIQPYKNATQSGVTPLAYHFEKPMLVTNVGGLADMVPDNVAGVVVEPNAVAIANGIQKMYQLGENHYLPQLRIEKEKYSWKHLTDAILQLAGLK
jgi:glycosyltransferase involved in cell wall biosynthesis